MPNYTLARIPPTEVDVDAIVLSGGTAVELGADVRGKARWRFGYRGAFLELTFEPRRALTLPLAEGASPSMKRLVDILTNAELLKRA